MFYANSDRTFQWHVRTIGRTHRRGDGLLQCPIDSAPPRTGVDMAPIPTIAKFFPHFAVRAFDGTRFWLSVLDSFSPGFFWICLFALIQKPVLWRLLYVGFAGLFSSHELPIPSARVAGFQLGQAAANGTKPTVQLRNNSPASQPWYSRVGSQWRACLSTSLKDATIQRGR
jgi:hypothetical protein